MQLTPARPPVGRTVVFLAAAAAMLAGCSREPATVLGASAPVTSTATGIGSPGGSAAGPAPAPTQAASRTTPAATPVPTLPAAATWRWRTDRVRLPDGTVAEIQVPTDWPLCAVEVDGHPRHDRRSPDGSLLLRIEYAAATGTPAAAVQQAATQPYASWTGYAVVAAREPNLEQSGVTGGGSEFTFRDATGSRYARVDTFARAGWVLTVYTSGPDRTGTGHWELAQKAGDVRFTRP